jgi:hypothetical protein
VSIQFAFLMKPKGRQGTVLSSFSRSFGLIIPRKKQLGNAKIFSDPSIPLSSHLLRNLGERFLQGGASCNIPSELPFYFCKFVHHLAFMHLIMSLLVLIKTTFGFILPFIFYVWFSFSLVLPPSHLRCSNLQAYLSYS